MTLGSICSMGFDKTFFFFGVFALDSGSLVDSSSMSNVFHDFWVCVNNAVAVSQSSALENRVKEPWFETES